MLKINELTDIIETERKNISNEIRIGDIDKYIIELIRISEMYKFEVKIKLKKPVIRHLENKETKVIIEIKENIENQIKKKEEKEEEEEKKPYISIKDNFEDVKINYGQDLVKIKDIEYKVEKPKIRLQELWEKEGFYQEKTTQAKVRVQLWPEHLPYDHFKRKRAFLFT